jgi:hypothetical protein
MNIKRFVVPALALGAGIGLARRLFAAAEMAKPAAPGASYEAIDAYVIAQMRRLKIPGASLAIVEGDQIVHTRGFGRARPGGGAGAPPGAPAPRAPPPPPPPPPGRVVKRLRRRHPSSSAPSPSRSPLWR